MRFVFFYDRESGGVPVTTALLACAFRRQEHRVMLCGPTSTLPEKIGEELKVLGVEIIDVSIKKWIAMPRWGVERVREFAADLLVSTHRGCDIRVGLLARRLRLPHVIVVRSDPAADDRRVKPKLLWLRNFLWRRVMRRASAVIAVSEYVKRSIVRYGLATEGKVSVCYNFISPKVFTFASKEKTGFHSPVRLLAVGRLEPEKRPFDFPQLLRILLEKGLEVAGRWVGDGSLGRKMRGEIERTGLRGVVELRGGINDPQNEYIWADILVNFGTDEGFGLVLIEAMAKGTPVVAFHAGAVPEVVEDGKTGFLCPVGDLECMADKIIELSENTELYRRLSRAAIERAKLFSEENRVGCYEKVFRKVLERWR